MAQRGWNDPAVNPYKQQNDNTGADESEGASMVLLPWVYIYMHRQLLQLISTKDNASISKYYNFSWYVTKYTVYIFSDTYFFFFF